MFCRSVCAEVAIASGLLNSATMIGSDPSDSIADAQEQELIRHLIRDWHWGRPVVSMFCADSASLLLPELPLSGLGREGDLDLLCVTPASPDRAIAVQFKLAKVRQSTYYTLQPNKLINQ